MIHATELLSSFIDSLEYAQLSLEVIKATKLFILDYYAACFAGIKVNSKFNHAIWHILKNNGGRPEASVLLAEKKIPAMDAAFMNAIYAHGADMDDGNRKAMGHIAAHVMSAVFGMSETMEVSGKDIIVAINVGYEVYNRIAAAAQPGLVQRGFHSTGTAGAIACGAACAKLMKLDATGIYQAMALAAVQASGLMIVTESGQECKPLNPANAARTGIFSAKLSATGIMGPKNPLESGMGWFHAMSGEINDELILDGLGEKFTICESYLKPYPSCRHTHCAIECALEIRERIIKRYGKINGALIRKICLYTYKNAIAIAGQIKIPDSSEESKFSIHYALATALIKGRFSLNELEVLNMGSEIQDIIEKIELKETPLMEDRKAGVRGAKLDIILFDGTNYTKEIMLPKGDALNPFTWNDVLIKLTNCSEGILSMRQRERLVSFIDTFEFLDRYLSINESLKGQ